VDKEKILVSLEIRKKVFSILLDKTAQGTCAGFIGRQAVRKDLPSEFSEDALSIRTGQK
jgi:hypothetical protein